MDDFLNAAQRAAHKLKEKDAQIKQHEQRIAALESRNESLQRQLREQTNGRPSEQQAKDTSRIQWISKAVRQFADQIDEEGQLDGSSPRAAIQLSSTDEPSPSSAAPQDELAVRARAKLRLESRRDRRISRARQPSNKQRARRHTTTNLLRRPKAVNAYYTSTVNRIWAPGADAASRRRRTRLSTIGRIEETAEGILAPSPCSQCAARNKTCWVFEEAQNGDACSRCRYSGRTCVFGDESTPSSPASENSGI